MPTPDGAIRVANCSGFYGDRIAAAKEQVEGGDIDYLTGDWLAELTMLILARTRAGGRSGGWARTFLTQMEQVLGTCLDKGIKVVTNAGGLDPQGCANALTELAAKLGLAPRVAYVAGDDLLGRMDELGAAGVSFDNLDTGESLRDKGVEVITANAYLGCWGIVEALDRGADVVITGRVTDAAVVMGPPAHAFGWQRQDWDRLAGACVAGHVIECGCQATGGNYSFFTEIPGMQYLGFPIAEIFPDGSSVITKHHGTGGAVTIGTVTSQLLYEIGSERYLNPDVVCRFDTIKLHEIGPDRVRISGTRGEPAPATLKVSMNYQGGFRNGFTFCLTGLDIEEKADLLQRQIWSAFPNGEAHFEQARVQLMRNDKADPDSNEEATALLKFTVKDRDERKVGRDFANQAVEIGLATIPGFYGLGWSPGPGTPYGVYWPSLVPAEMVPQEVVVLGEGATAVDNTPGNLSAAPVLPESAPLPTILLSTSGTVRAPLGRAFGSRSGDKGGNANLGVFARSAEGYVWLASFLTVARLKELLADVAHLTVHRYELPNIWSLNFVVVGLLEEGVAASSRQDGQAKSLGEYLRAKLVDLPEGLL
ncbi:MAG: acyclic terpene utilization AtuA family protein [Acidimicrobiales bacterium]